MFKSSKESHAATAVQLNKWNWTSRQLQKVARIIGCFWSMREYFEGYSCQCVLYYNKSFNLNIHSRFWSLYIYTHIAMLLLETCFTFRYANYLYLSFVSKVAQKVKRNPLYQCKTSYLGLNTKQIFDCHFLSVWPWANL